MEEDNDYEENEIIGYYCIGCGYVQKGNGWGGQCERCTGCSLEEIYD